MILRMAEERDGGVGGERERMAGARLGRVRARMEQARVDAFLVTHPANIFYLSGFSGDAGALVVEPDRARLFTDGRFTAQAREELRGGVGARIVAGPLPVAVGRALGRGKRLRVAFEAARVTVAEKGRLARAAGPKVRWVSAEGWVERLRAVKDAREVGVVREAAVLASEALEQVLRLVRPGVREDELAAELEYRMKRLGASGPAFETIVASGPRAALPHARASSKRLRKNELVVIDMGAILRRYCSDLTRTVYLGRAPERIRRWYRAVREAQEAAAEALRPGRRAEAVDRAARRVLGRFRLDRAFVHSTGHGLGLEIHEAPRLGRHQTDVLEAGNIVTIEPGVYFEGVGGIRLEDDYAVGLRGAERLTTARQGVLEI
jgi:Xaa-Pro aminopeptidase